MCPSSKLINVSFLWAYTWHLPQQLYDLMLQTAMVSIQCNKPKKAVQNPMSVFQLFILFQWYRYYMNEPDWNIEHARGRTDNNNYYHNAEFYSSNLAQEWCNDSKWPSLIHFSCSRRKKFTKITKNNSVCFWYTFCHDSPDVKTIYQCCCISKCTAMACNRSWCH